MLTLLYPQGFGERQLWYSLVSLSFRPPCHRDDTVLLEMGIYDAVDILVLDIVAFDGHFTIN